MKIKPEERNFEGNFYKDKKLKIFVDTPHKFPIERIKLFQKHLFLLNFTAEEIFDEIFYELNYKITYSFFKMKMQVNQFISKIIIFFKQNKSNNEKIIIKLIF